MPRALIGSQRMLVDSLMTNCVKYASAGTSISKYVNKNKDIYKIMTWNVQGLNQVGKLENLLNEMKNLKCGVSETHLTGADDFITELPSKEKYRIINSGESSKIRGVVFIISQKLINLVSSVIIVSSRVIAIRIKANPVDIFLVQGYAPTMDKDQEVKEQFYEELRDTIKKKKEV